MESPKRRRLIVSGVVQGVGFRKFIDQAAKELQLSGWVRNLNDGTVEIDVQGSLAALDELGRQAIQGPARSTVYALRTENRQPDRPSGEFTIIA
ncbi:MAG: acylphosphatase [Chlorobiaceae bacterium]|nr:acylphosphatase [Chlorobiaceae bacterium]